LELYKQWKPKKAKKPEAISIESDMDWAMGTCLGLYAYDHFQHYPINKSSVHRKMKSTAKSLTTGDPKKPMLITFVSPDSFSRSHFFRKAPKIIDFLTRLKNEGKYDVFDFKLHNIIGADTAENLSRVFGTKFDGFYKRDKKNKKDEMPDDLFGKDAIWKHFKAKGFAT
jgi:hypothetical protein